MNSSFDPRRGDIEDDASSPKSKSMLALAGRLLVELSFPKLIVAWIFLLILPGLALGLAPMIVSAWINMVSGKITSPFSGIWPASALVLLALAAWYGWRALFRLVETSFWSLAPAKRRLCQKPSRTARTGNADVSVFGCSHTGSRKPSTRADAGKPLLDPDVLFVDLRLDEPCQVSQRLLPTKITSLRWNDVWHT